MKTIEILPGNRRIAGRVVPASLLMCGVFASLLYVAMNIICAMQYPGYSSASQTVSELSAIDAPSRPLWVMLAMVYSTLSIALGLGLWKSGDVNRKLRIVGALIIVNAVIGIFWPPMHQRQVLAAGGGTVTDTLHIVFSIVAVLLMIVAIVFSAAAMGKWFRVYSISTIVIVLLFGFFTAWDSPRMEADLPTPWIGVWERISIGAYLLWAALLPMLLIKTTNQQLITATD